MLRTVQDLDVEIAVSAPGDVGEIALFVEVGDVQIDDAFATRVVNTQFNVLGGLSVHRIFDVVQLAGTDVEQREIADAAFVLAVEGQRRECRVGGVRADEESVRDVEFVAADGLAIDYAAAAGQDAFPPEVDVAALFGVRASGNGALDIFTNSKKKFPRF